MLEVSQVKNVKVWRGGSGRAQALRFGVVPDGLRRSAMVISVQLLIHAFVRVYEHESLSLWRFFRDFSG